MSSLPRSRRTPKATAAAVRLAPLSSPAESWPAWTDNFYWECGSDAHDLANHIPSPELPEPDAPDGRRDGAALWAEMMIEASLPPVETDAEFLARLDAQDLAERHRIETTYFPTLDDIADYEQWLSSLGDALPADVRESCHTIEEWDAIRNHQVTSDELAQLAAHGCI